MLTEMRQQFVEVAARTIHAWTANNEPVPEYWDGEPTRIETYRWLRNDDPVSLAERDTAAYLLGRLEGVNDTTIEQIVLAVRDVVESDCATSDCPDHWHCDPAAAAHVCYMDRENTACRTCGARQLDTVALFRAITLEFLTGEGKVREEFGEVRVYRGENQSVTRPLVIPRLAEGASDAVR